MNASIPGMLATFHNEWDALMLETHDLKKDLNSVRQELSLSLYQHDAACRVIARLVKERDEARLALVNVQASFMSNAVGKRTAADDISVDTLSGHMKRSKSGLSPVVIDALTSKSEELSNRRKQREIGASLSSSEAMQAYVQKTASPCHKTSTRGIYSLVLNPFVPTTIATAGADGSIALFDAGKGKRRALLTGHLKRTNSVSWAGSNTLLSGSNDKCVKIWHEESDGKYLCVATMKDVHAKDVVSVSTHPTNTYACSVGVDNVWAFYDIVSTECLSVVKDEGEGGYLCGGFHPDGLIFATGGSDSVVKVWDMKTQKSVAKVEGHAGAVQALSFSENGYYLATGGTDGVKLWDLRKLKKIRSLDAVGSATSVAFDHSGNYLAVGGNEASVYDVKKELGVIKTWEVEKGPATALGFAPDASALYLGSGDHNIRVYA